ncbi:MAG TPA: hypothetical protein VFT51_05955 [Bacillales bacterium]|nr:hypothetical protein [Bacillales bacterium]
MVVFLGVLFGFSVVYSVLNVRRVLPYLKTTDGGSFSRGKVTVVVLLLFFLNGLGVWAISDVFTISPDRVSGNGNPAILLMMPLMPLFAMFVLAVALVSYHLFFRISTSMNFIVSTICLVLTLICIFIEMNLVDHLVEALGGPPSETDSRIYRFDWFNQYTNPLYFNWATLSMSILVTIMGTGIWTGWSRSSKRKLST